MSRAEHTISIRRPAADVFAFVTDPDKTLLWQPSVIEVVREDAGSLTVGSRFTEVRRLLGTSLRSTFEVTELSAPHRSGVEVVEGPVAARASYSLRDTPEGTELRLAYQMDAAGFLRVAEQLATRVVVREFEASLGHLKDVLESRVGA